MPHVCRLYIIDCLVMQCISWPCNGTLRKIRGISICRGTYRAGRRAHQGIAVSVGVKCVSKSSQVSQFGILDDGSEGHCAVSSRVVWGQLEASCGHDCGFASSRGQLEKSNDRGRGPGMPSTRRAPYRQRCLQQSRSRCV